MTDPAEVWATIPEEAAEVEYVSLPVSALAWGERRMEAETYLTGGYGVRVQIEAALPFDRLGAIADVWQPSRLKATQVGSESGLPFFTATQAFDIRPVARKWLAPSKTPDLARRLVERDWALVTCSGSVGETIMSYGPHLNAVISHDLLRVQVRDPKRRGYVYAFLRSRFGRMVMRSSQYGSIIKHLEPEHLAEVPVPEAADGLYEEMNGLIDHVFELRERAFHLTLEAENLYARQFGPLKDHDDEGFAVSAREMFSGRRRLDAFHYNPRARDIERSLSTGDVDHLDRLVERVILPNRFARVYVQDGIPYLDSGDIFKVNPETTKFIARGSRKDLDKYLVERDWLLLARSGQTYGLNGSVMLANGRHEGKVVSEHIIRIVPRAIRPGYLAMALGHPLLGRSLIKRLTFGSSVPEIAPEDLASVPVPRLGAVEAEIADRMEEASGLRMKADEGEDAAVEYLQRDLERKLHGEEDEAEPEPFTPEPFTREDFFGLLKKIKKEPAEAKKPRQPSPRD